MNNPFTFISSIYSVNLSTKLLEMIKNPSTKLQDVLDEEALVSDFKDGKAHVVD